MKVIIILLICILPGCCYKYNKNLEYMRAKTLKKENPVKYRFHSPISEVSKIFDSEIPTDIYGVTESNYYNNLHCRFNKVELTKNSKDTVRIKYWLGSHGMTGKSSTYYSNEGFLDFDAWFDVKVDKIDSNHTDVEVKITNMWVVYGRYFNFHCWCCAYNDIDIEPNTVEEYKLLLYIGKVLGEKNMPEIILPE